jgi:hypothetical protein
LITGVRITPAKVANKKTKDTKKLLSSLDALLKKVDNSIYISISKGEFETMVYIPDFSKSFSKATITKTLLELKRAGYEAEKDGNYFLIDWKKRV